ncbi:MAG: hypothetical protein ACREQW_02985 [Candidatus Binatia bacterium]
MVEDADRSHDTSYSSAAELLFQPDPLTFSQFLETVRKGSFHDPEKVLMLAILKDAVMSFQKYLLSHRDKERNVFEETERWILSENREWPFSFTNICEVLGIHPQYLRKGLVDWKRKNCGKRAHDASWKKIP